LKHHQGLTEYHIACMTSGLPFQRRDQFETGKEQCRINTAQATGEYRKAGQP